MSIRPGTTHFPSAEITSPWNRAGGSPARNSRTFPFSSTRWPISSRPEAGSITLPPLMSNMGSSSEKVEKRHPDGYPGLDLPQHQGPIAVCQFVGQFYPPIDRSRVHDHRVILCERKDVSIQAIFLGIFP